MIVSAFGFFDVLGPPHIVLDPSRGVARVVSGIGFLGAGAIPLRGEIVRGLTTAADLEYQAIRDKLRALPGVTRCDDGNGGSGDE